MLWEAYLPWYVLLLRRSIVAHTIDRCEHDGKERILFLVLNGIPHVLSTPPISFLLYPFPYPSIAYSFGDGFLGTLGHSRTHDYLSKPTLIDTLASCTMMSGDCGWGHTAYLTREGNVILLGRPTDFKNTLRHIHMRGTIPAFQKALNMLGTTVFKEDMAPQFYSFVPSSSAMTPTKNGTTKDENTDSAFIKLSSTVVRNFMKAVSSPTQSVLGPLPSSSSSIPFSSTDSSTTTTTVFPSSITPVHIVCGKGALTGVVTQEGNVFLLGSNSFGQCGNEKVSELETDFVLLHGIESNEKIINLSLGLEHGAAVSNYGTVYTWGRGDRGQCGHGDNAHYKQAMRIAGPDNEWLFKNNDKDNDIDHKFIAVSCGHAVTTAINAKGELWIWGKMASTVPKKSIGDGEIMQDQLLPRKITFFDETKTTKDETNESIASTKLSEATSFQNILQERNIVNLMKGTDEELSTSNTLLTRADTLVKGVYVPKLTEASTAALPHRKVVAVTHGQAHTSILCNDGSIWMIGLRGRGILYDDSDTIKVPLPVGCTHEPENIGGPTLIIPSTTTEANNNRTKGTINNTDSTTESSSSSSSTFTNIPVPEVRIEVDPYLITNLGPLEGKIIIKLRSSLHHSYAITNTGEVYRWGWKGIVLPVKYLETETVTTDDNNSNNNNGKFPKDTSIPNDPETTVRSTRMMTVPPPSSTKVLIPHELAFGYAHTIVLA